MGPTDNGKSLFYCSLLALQFGLQPIISSSFTGSRVSKTSVVVATEVFKIIIATVSIFSGPKAEIDKIRENWTLSSSIKIAALPATLYAIQNLLVQHGFIYLDPMTFNLLNQTKTISAAFWLYILLDQKQSTIQIFALLLLLVAAVALNMSSDAASIKHDHVHKPWGILYISCSSVLSGLSAALTQRAMNQTGKKQRHVFLLSAEMAVYGIIFLILNLAFVNNDVQVGGHVLSNWSVWTFIPVLTNAFGGLVVGLVTKYAGGVRKGFALIAGIVTTGFAQWIISSKPLGTKDLIGVVLVSVSIYLHTSYPPAKKLESNNKGTESECNSEKSISGKKFR